MIIVLLFQRLYLAVDRQYHEDENELVEQAKDNIISGLQVSINTACVYTATCDNTTCSIGDSVCKSSSGIDVR